MESFFGGRRLVSPAGDFLTTNVPLSPRPARAQIVRCNPATGVFLKVMPSETSDYAAMYSAMSDEQLLVLARSPDTLVDAAQAALRRELEIRQLKLEVLRAEPVQFETASAPVAPETNELPPIRSIGGWLIPLASYLALQPLFTLWVTGVQNAQLGWALEQYPRLRTVLVIQTTVVVVLSILSICAGLGLWRKWSNCVRLARISLMAYLAYCLYIFVPPFLIGLPPELRNRILLGLAWIAALGFAWNFIWLIYLQQSQRVRRTYRNV